MDLLVLFGIIIFCIIGEAICIGLESVTEEAKRAGETLIRESEKAQKDFDQAVLAVQSVVSTPPPQVVITEVYESPTEGRQLTEYELREMIYTGVGFVLDKKMDAADLAVKLSEEMKSKLDIRVKNR